ncbi:Leucine Rich Repeat [Seminavis robusta]|uniref:Leucine Rich Repeat n=1 Tax=Seminavis robusta TaxID=568900 RepID=A0A9N8E4E2_9STRA|nr:Leucine Rich Repeat [Seminavis robusta]|eukprot:Sro606_g174530.1 Leucine Rich Repeat (831) ;mRNA; f:43770-46666
MPAHDDESSQEDGEENLLDVIAKMQAMEAGGNGTVDDSTTNGITVGLDPQAEKAAARNSVGAALSTGEDPTTNGIAVGLNPQTEKAAARNSVGAAISTGEALPRAESSKGDKVPAALSMAGDTIAVGVLNVEDGCPKDEGQKGGKSSNAIPSAPTEQDGRPLENGRENVGPAPVPLRRGTNHPTSRPGAVAVGGTGISAAAPAAPPEAAQGNFHQQAQTVTNDGIARARLVNTDEEENRQNADPVREGDLRMSIGNSKTDGREAFKAIFLISIVGFIVLGLVLGLTGEKDEETVAPTSLPTSAPSLAPTAYSDTLDLPDYTQEAILDDSNSSQARAYSWLMEDPNLESYPDWRVLQRFALATFYYSTGGTDWTINDNWLNHSQDECKDWAFRTDTDGFDPTTRDDKIIVNSPCDANGRYQYLLMSGNNLAGSVPQEVGLLSSLLIFEFSKNDLGGSTLPSEIGLLTNLLRMTADRSYLDGTVPTEIGLMTGLIELFLGYNPFPSPIPSEIANIRGLKKINLNRAGFTGTFPPELYTLTDMQVFNVHGLLGITEASLKGIEQMTDLIGFSCHNFPLNGTAMPTELGLLTKLMHLNLWDTGFTGTVPSELLHLTVLERLDIDDNKLTGTFPGFLLELTTLEMILYNGNFFTGTIPAVAWENMTKLDYLFLSNNLLSGTIPTEFGLLESARYLLMEHNLFSGTLPTEIGNLTALKELWVHGTDITGTVPTEYEEIPELELITLSNTLLTGSIPNGICDSLMEVTWGCETRFDEKLHKGKSCVVSPVTVCVFVFYISVLVACPGLLTWMSWCLLRWSSHSSFCSLILKSCYRIQ